MLADHRHPEIGAVLAAIALRDREAQTAAPVGEVFHPPPPPRRRRPPAIFEIGARPFAAVIEETDVIIGLFDRFYLLRDELVELTEIGDEVGRQCEIHGAAPTS